jgi:hypothetical protein
VVTRAPHSQENGRNENSGSKIGADMGLSARLYHIGERAHGLSTHACKLHIVMQDSATDLDEPRAHKSSTRDALRDAGMVAALASVQVTERASKLWRAETLAHVLPA